MRRLLVGLGVLALLLVAADRGAKYLVETTLADHVERKEGITGGVDVSIAGFPFLTQVVQNRFDEVDLSTPQLEATTPAGSVKVEDVEVDLRGVETSHRFTEATAASATGTGLVPYSAFDQFDPITVEYGGASPDGSGYLTVSAPSLGSESVRVAPSAADGLTLDLAALSTLSAALPKELRAFVGAEHEFGGLPHGITITSLDATESGLQVTLAGEDVTIAE
jgi:hypothetical protein